MCIRDRSETLRAAVLAFASKVYIQKSIAYVERIREEGVETPLAVSYTHLDVYKRQEEMIDADYFQIGEPFYLKSGDAVANLTSCLLYTSIYRPREN